MSEGGSTWKKVSVITGTWQRHELVIDAVQNIRAQTYPNIEHCIVSDGPDFELQQWIKEDSLLGESNVPIKFVELGRNWSSFLAASWSAVPFQVAQWLASGDYLMWMADDERFTPDHIEALVDLLENGNNDFVYSKCEIYFHPKLLVNQGRAIIGTNPPVCGQVTNALYRKELLDYRGFETHIGSGTDWDQVEQWMAAGAKYDMLDRVTMTHRVDKIGEGPDFRINRQPLSER